MMELPAVERISLDAAAEIVLPHICRLFGIAKPDRRPSFQDRFWAADPLHPEHAAAAERCRHWDKAFPLALDWVRRERANHRDAIDKTTICRALFERRVRICFGPRPRPSDQAIADFIDDHIARTSAEVRSLRGLVEAAKNKNFNAQRDRLFAIARARGFGKNKGGRPSGNRAGK